MKRIYLLLLSGFCFNQSAFAQQTYFNVPSSDVVEKHEISVQQQINFSESIRSSTTVNYGLGREWEIGVNLYNIDFQPSQHRIVANDSTTEKSFSPLGMLNAQKAFNLTKNIEVAMGAQAGLNVLTHRHPQWVGYMYGHVATFSTNEHYNFSAGAYLANARYLGDGPNAGFQTGFDAGILYQKLHVLGDWISGPHDFGQLVLGLEVYLGKHVPLALGWQRLNKTGAQAVVLQVTYNPK